MGKDLVKYEEKFPVLKSPENLIEVIKTNIGDDFTPFDLDRISIDPKKGAFIIPKAEGDMIVSSFEAIILYQKKKNNNAYWVTAYDPTSASPPDCRSDDGITGIGTPGGSCKVCPLNQFGSDKNGKGKACKNILFVFPTMEGDNLPFALPVPPASIKLVKRYMQQLARGGLSYLQIISKFELIDVAGYYQIKCSVAKDKNDNPKVLSAEDYNILNSMVFGDNGLRDVFEATRVETAEDYATEEPVE